MVWHVPAAWRTNRLYSGHGLIFGLGCLYVGRCLYAVGLAYSLYCQCSLGACGFVYSFETTRNTCIPKSARQAKEVNIPFKEVITKHFSKLVLGTIAAICTFVVFYLTTVFALNWGTNKLGYARGEFLELQLIATLCFAAFIPISAVMAEKFGRKNIGWHLFGSSSVWSIVCAVA